MDREREKREGRKNRVGVKSALAHSLVGKISHIIRVGKNCYECSEVVWTISFSAGEDWKTKTSCGSWKQRKNF